MIPLSVPVLQGNEWTYIKECLDTGWVSSAGKYVDRFEEDVARFTGAQHAVACVSGTAALHVALRLLGAHNGISAQPTIDVPAGQDGGVYVLNANGDAEVGHHTVAVQGEADGGRGLVLATAPPVEFDVAPPFVTLKLDLAAVEQGQTVQLVAHVTPNRPFTGKAKLSLRGLPAQATCADLECESVESTLVFDVATTKETPVGKHTTLFCQVVIEQDGEPTLDYLGGGAILRVDPPAPPAAAPEPAVAAAAAPAAAPSPAAKRPLSRLEQLREEARQKAEAAAKPAGGRP